MDKTPPMTEPRKCPKCGTEMEEYWGVAECPLGPDQCELMGVLHDGVVSVSDLRAATDELSALRARVAEQQAQLDTAMKQVVVLRRRCETVVPVLDEAMDLLSWLKHDLYSIGKGDYNGKIPCCQEDGEQQLVQLRATLADTNGFADQWLAAHDREVLGKAVQAIFNAIVHHEEHHAPQEPGWEVNYKMLMDTLRSAAGLDEKEK